MRRADLAHLTSLTVGCALFAACADSTSPVPRKVTPESDGPEDLRAAVALPRGNLQRAIH